jgi:hypothetical protein
VTLAITHGKNEKYINISEEKPQRNRPTLERRWEGKVK